MKSVSKKIVLMELQDTVEQHISLCIREFQNLSEQALNQTPKEGGWSVAQCLYHLTTYGHHYLPAVKKAITQSAPMQEDELLSSGLLGNYFIGLIKNPRKYKAPPKHSPRRNQYTQEVVSEFIEQEEEWLLLLRKAEIVSIESIRIKTTISPLIRLKLLDTLTFIAYHNERHLQQAYRTAKR